MMNIKIGREETARKFSTCVIRIMGSNVKKIILYGSYARGDYNENSDMDIMILTSLKDKDIEKAEEKICDMAYDYLLSDGVMIVPQIVNVDQFEYWLGALPFYDNIKKEGIVLAG